MNKKIKLSLWEQFSFHYGMMSGIVLSLIVFIALLFGFIPEANKFIWACELSLMIFLGSNFILSWNMITNKLNGDVDE